VAEQAKDAAGKPKRPRRAKAAQGGRPKAKPAGRARAAPAPPPAASEAEARAERKRRARAERRQRATAADGAGAEPLLADRLQRIEDELHRQSELSDELLRKMEGLAAG
jgi:hypothetical protein